MRGAATSISPTRPWASGGSSQSSRRPRSERRGAPAYAVRAQRRHPARLPGARRGEHDVVLVLDWASHLEAVSGAAPAWRSSLRRSHVSPTFSGSTCGGSACRTGAGRRGGARGLGRRRDRGDGCGGLRACRPGRSGARGPDGAHGGRDASRAYRVPGSVNGIAPSRPRRRLPGRHAPGCPGGRARGARDDLGDGGPDCCARLRPSPTVPASSSGGDGSSATRGRPRMALAKARTILELDVRHVLPLVDVPTLVIQSRDNTYVRVRSRPVPRRAHPGRTAPRARQRGSLACPEPAAARRDRGVRDRLTPASPRTATASSRQCCSSTSSARPRADRARRSAVGARSETLRAARAARRSRCTGESSSTPPGARILATFDGPARAMRCASEDSRRGARRAGSGACGVACTRARSRGARAASAGSRCTSVRACPLSPQPGEVLVTRTVRDLVAGSGIAFEERGEQRAEGCPDRWALYAATS